MDGCITIEETIFPFTLDTVSTFHGKTPRNGWYLQQLLKLYAGTIIPGILDRYLVIDADTFFLRPITFVEDTRCLYNYGSEHHAPYFEHMLRVDAELTKVDATKSGICHHMMFETRYVNELITKIETQHNDRFYNVFLQSVSESYRNLSGASEYEIYFNYMLRNHRDRIVLRKLQEGVDYHSDHWYNRPKKTRPLFPIRNRGQSPAF